jgi:bacteriocin biosynthesis cyclodehydratase domain-containing protein
MVLRLDPTLPVVWRTPDSLQIGIDSPVVVLEQVTIADERLLSALRSGVAEPALPAIGELCGLRPAETAALLAALSPALERPRAAVDQTLALLGGGPTAEALASAATACGARVTRPERPEDLDTGAGLAVVVAGYVVDAFTRTALVRRDIRVLPVVLGDTTARIGPLLVPGVGPCLYCLELHHRDADPAWPAVATQLQGRPPAAETAVVALEVAGLAARLALDALADERFFLPAAVVLDAATGALSARDWPPHPECACRGLAPSTTHRGTGSPDAADAARFAPTTGAAAAARG